MMTAIRPIYLPLCLALILTGCESTKSSSTPAAARPATAAAPREELHPEDEASRDYQPIDMAPTGSKPVVYQRTILTMETGATIGKISAGWLHVPAGTITSHPGEGSKQFAYVAREELLKAHYTIPGGNNQLFGDNESAKARYQLGAEIPKMHFDVHVQPGWTRASETSSGSVTVIWQLYDTLTQKVVFKKTTETTFHYEGPADEGDADVFQMFRKSFRRLLAEPDFVAFMRPGAAEEEAAAATESELKISVGGSREKLELPGDFPSVLESFVAVEPGAALGSGFLISSDGYVLTAAHVVSGLKTVPVRLRGGMVLEATVVRLNENADTALLKIPGTSYRPLLLVSEATPAPLGSEVYAIGNPAAKELTASVSRGVVSGNREIDGRKFIQTDAAANPGSSGGPLLRKDGHVLGLISWKFAGPEFQGLAFVIPIHEGLGRMHVTLAE